MLNPFSNSKSPILQIYKKSRSKSQENKSITRHRSSSFKEFQVKMIQKALNHNHIIQKEYRGTQKKQYQRERMRSKFYGAQAQRFNNPSQLDFKENVSPTKSQYFMMQNEVPKSVRFDRKMSDSSKMETMVNMGDSLHRPNSKKKMSYESNYNICQQSQSEVFYSDVKVSSMKRSTPSHLGIERSLERKCSIVSSLDEYEIEQSFSSRKDGSSGFKIEKELKDQREQKVNFARLQEEYFNGSQKGMKKSSDRRYFP